MTMIIAVAVVGCLCFAGGYMLGSSGDNEDREVIVAAGSTTIQPLMSLFKEEYEKDHMVNIGVMGGGSSAGISNALNGTADIGMVSRLLRGPGEIDAGLIEHKIAMDAVVIIVHQSVYNGGITSITLDELKAIYMSSGTATNWSSIGSGAYTAPIVPMDREAGSGTRDTFDSLALGSSSAVHKSGIVAHGSAGAMETAVSNTPNSIGYVGMDALGHLPSTVKVLEVVNPSTSTPVAPSESTVQNGTYVLNRYLTLCTLGAPEAGGAVEAFIKWIQSPAGQDVVSAGGFVKLPSA